MRFLVLTEGKYPLPPEMTPRIMEGMMSWVDKYQREGKIETIWSIAGRRAGGGILNVDSAEELDRILGEAPLTAFSDVEVLPITDIQGSMQRAMEVFNAMSRS